MSKIQETFKNELLEISIGINNLQMEGCIQNFSNYLTSQSSGIEKKFIDKLNEGINDFVNDIEMDKLKELPPSELLDIISQKNLNGAYSLCDDICDNGIYCALTERFKDADIYTDIVNYMKKTYNELSIELARTKEEEEIEELKRQITLKSNDIQYHENHINTANKEIKELEEKLKRLERIRDL